MASLTATSNSGGVFVTVTGTGTAGLAGFAAALLGDGAGSSLGGWALGFLHRAGVYRHGHRIDVVNAGIEIIAALEQRNRIELGGILLASAQLHHRQRARSTRFARSLRRQKRGQ